MTADIRRAGDRLHTRTAWLDSRHSFSFGEHYDPDNTHFGLLLASNEDTVSAESGFDTHPHRDMEIVTWVLSGALMHQDFAGNADVVYPGLAQRVSAGTGILHSERNAGDDPVHFVQMWVSPDQPGRTPGYEQLDIGAELAGGGLVLVASGMTNHSGAAAIRINQPHAALHIARLHPGGEVAVPAAPFAHVFVADGQITLEDQGALCAGDAARLSAADGERVIASEAGAEVLLWEMHAQLG